MIEAILVTFDVGNELERAAMRNSGLNIGDRIQVRKIAMGKWATTISLVDGGHYNSSYFKFEENGEPLDIFNDKRFNPYLV